MPRPSSRINFGLYLVLILILVAGVSRNSLAQEPVNNSAPAATKRATPDPVEMRRAIQKLTAENDRLRARVQELETTANRFQTRDRLTQEEQRVENLQAQVFAVVEKEAALQARMDDVNEQLRPENIDNLSIMGSTRPEEVRESTRRRLTNEQGRIQSQLDLLSQSRMRLQSSLSVSDMIIQNLRLKLQTGARP